MKTTTLDGSLDLDLIAQAKALLKDAEPKRRSAEFLHRKLGGSISRAEAIMKAIEAENAPKFPAEKKDDDREDQAKADSQTHGGADADADDDDDPDGDFDFDAEANAADNKIAEEVGGEPDSDEDFPDVAELQDAGNDESPQRGHRDKSPPIDPVIVNRLSILDDMPRGLKKIAREIRHLLEVASHSSLINHWDIGAKIQEAIDGIDVYGSNAVEEIAKYFGREPAWAYDHRNVMNNYGRNDVIKLAKREMPSGNRLEWGHLLQLSRVYSDVDRKKFEEMTFAKSLTVRQLGDEVAGADPDHGRAPGHGGRKPAKPKSIYAGLHQVDTTAAMVTKKIPLWIECALQGTTDLEPKKFDRLLHQMIQKTQKSVQQLGEQVPNLIAALGKLQERCEQVLKAGGKSSGLEESPVNGKGNRRAQGKAKQHRRNLRPEAA